MSQLNQFSYPIIALIAVIGALVVMRRLIRLRWRYVAGVVVALIFLFSAGFFLLRPGAGDVSDLQTARSMIGNNRPTFVEFFSNYCTGCLLLRPTVDGIVADIDDEFNILRINIHSAEGRALREQYDYSFTPEFVLFDAQGQEVWRDHAPPTLAQLELARCISC
jgi:thiol-disulfide isomerase/thioredoxin